VGTIAVGENLILETLDAPENGTERLDQNILCDIKGLEPDTKET